MHLLLKRYLKTQITRIFRNLTPWSQHNKGYYAKSVPKRMPLCAVSVPEIVGFYLLDARTQLQLWCEIPHDKLSTDFGSIC